MMWSVTACGWETITTCELSSSTTSAPALDAIVLTMSVPAALSSVAITAHDGRPFHAGIPDRSLNAAAATGRWVAAITAVRSGGRSAAKASWNFPGSISNSGAVSPSRPVGYSR
jgi:hypothetical protein